ncbi:MAG: EAL domain-containing protein [Pseudorhodoplanes sp.]|nr:hypothetical protein [Pseudorhodoplanes sp.]MBW7950856.1 EAL domain-containing protein [Pseudorhodoplanes sp.]MCQ3942174.1 EAL domain-containing protein [Alphaproteobacteria bacterium]GIK81617.1 MAG: diguanylate phosphodiesterase [Alphaproteobacteria bacterium]
MLRLTAIFVAACMVVIAASVGAVVFLAFGVSGAESAIVGIAVLTALVLYNTVATRMRDRSDVGDQIADLSRGTADLARQVAELGRKLAAFETEAGGIERRVKAVTGPLSVEIGELGTLVKNLAETVAAHETQLETQLEHRQEARPEARPEAAPEPRREEHGLADDKEAAALAVAAEAAATPAASPERAPDIRKDVGTGPFKGKTAEEIVAIVRAAVEANRLDLYLQPVLTLPQRKVRYYEAMTRMRMADDTLVLPGDFLAHAEKAGLMPRIDNLMLFRCVQVLRRLLMKNREIGLFCNISVNTLSDPEFFPQLSQFMDANRALSGSLMLEFPQKAWQDMGPIEHESLAALAECGFRFSMDQVTDLRMEPRELSERGIRFVKVNAALLLNKMAAPADIHAADLSDLLGRHGISLIAERIETEAVVVDLLDYDVRFGQGFLFSPPRPVRPEALQGIPSRNDVVVREDNAAGKAPAPASAPSPVPVVLRPAAEANPAPGGGPDRAVARG